MKRLSFLLLFSMALALPAAGFAQAQPAAPPRIRPTLPSGPLNRGQSMRPGGLPSPAAGPQQQGGQAIRPAGPLPGVAPGVRPGRPPAAQPPAAALPPAPRTAPPPAGGSTAAPQAAPSASGPNDNAVMFVDAPLSEVLEEYYRVSKRRVLLDRGLEAVTVNIEVAGGGGFSDAEYQSIIEKGLLMHGYALVPSGTNLFKLVAAEQGTAPSSQGVPVILREEDLPQTDQVVSHVIQLNYLQAEEASSALQQLVPLHPYGKILAMANARALVVTEASQTIRAYLDLVKQVDVPPMDTMQKTFVLQRATAAEVVEQLSTLLGLNSSSGGSGSASRPVTPAAAPRPPGQPAALLPPGSPAAAAAGGTSATLGGAGGVSPEASKPVLQAIERNNSIIAIARPTDMLRIESLIRELDAESTTRRYFSRRLDYLDLTVFLNIAEKALQRNSKNSSSSGLPQDTSSTNRSTTNTNNTFGSNSAFGGSNSLGSSLGGGSFGGMGGGMSGGLGSGGGPQLDVTKKPLSVLIANTLVIADPASSKFFASGPPDQIQALEELADELDVRPRQIFISAIIGELVLRDTFRFGLDWVNTLRSIGDGDVIGGGLNTNGGAFAPGGFETIAGAVATGGPLGAAGLTAYGQINRSIGIFLRAVEQDENFHVLQKPTITTLNHQSASIYIGQQIAIAGQTFTNGGVNNGLGFTATTQFIPVRLQLDITPHIYNDNEVMLEFKQQNNGVTETTTNIGGSAVPNITEQGMVNSLIVPNNATAMLGGLITERDKKNKGGLPFLVRVPILKHLFGNTDNSKERRELIIFVQPSIMPDEHSHMLQQAKFGDHVGKFEETRAFGGTPNDFVPRADEVREAVPQPELAQPALVRPEKTEETKKSFFGKMKSLFTRDKKR